MVRSQFFPVKRSEHFKLVTGQFYIVFMKNLLKGGLGHEALALWVCLLLSQAAEYVFPFIRKLLGEACLIVNS